jgi:hypothetical protein
LAGNLTALAILTSSSLLRPRTVFHRYLAVLSVADLLFLLVNLIFM